MPDPITRLNAALEGRYRIERELGEGGMATVYLADDLRHERKVALKVLKPELAAVVGAERFLAEIKTTANLQHPHILPLFDSGEADQFLFYVMPYVEGESLRERLDREHQLPVDEAVRIASDVAEALEYAHSHGVIHRDIKPANILLQAGRPVISDFGIALAVSVGGGHRLTETGLSLGTPHYMSPEQATGDLSVGAATDIYAVGCVLYEMLVGEPPYTGSTPQAILGRIIDGEVPSARNERPSVPEHIDGAVATALEKLPADRFQSQGDFAMALADSGFRRARGTPMGTTPGLWRSIAIGLAVLAIFLGATWIRSWMGTEAAAPGRMHVVTPPEVSIFTGQGVGFTMSPDGNDIVFVGADSTGATQLWRRPLRDLQPSPIPGTENARNPRFSYDGELVAFTGNEAVSVVPLDGTPPVTLVEDVVPEGGGGLAWGPDHWIYYTESAQGIWRVNRAGGLPERVTSLSPGENGHQWVDALPSGRGVLFTKDIGGATEDEIWAVSLETGRTSLVRRAPMARYSPSGHLLFAAATGELFAAPFDEERLEIVGEGRPVGDIIQVNAGSAAQFDVSAAGSLLYVEGVGSRRGVPFWLLPDGSSDVLDPATEGHFHEVTLSPDGRHVAATHSREGSAHNIWIMDRAQGTFTPLSREGDNFAPFWSPDGQHVGYRSAGRGVTRFVERSVDGAGQATPLAVPDDRLGTADWSPDGRRLVYSVGSGNAADLHVWTRGSDDPPQVLLADGFNNRSPTVSPDGAWLAYESDESGLPQVYVRALDPTGGRAQISQYGGQQPRWVQDGQALLYQSGGSDWIIATIARPGVEVRERRRFLTAGTTVPVATGSNLYFSATSNADSLLVYHGQEVAARGVVVVQNLFEELERLVPTS